ncbi:hypothetical protein [Algihabitans albus]|uniref:hypothetical protein n=1 Tax=Algihabitans albus TaxID=2164067 RepID=UPI000E5D1F8E|nr:hypothetical protein [Algihabitans albus]
MTAYRYLDADNTRVADDNGWSGLASAVPPQPDGSPSVIAPFAPPAPTQQALLEAIRAEGSRRLLALTPDYELAERETWHQQAREALAHAADPATPCILLSAIAARRGITLVAMVQRVQMKAADFNAAAGAVLGAQHALELAAQAAQTPAELAAIDPADPAVWPA